MRTADAVKHFGSAVKLAEALGITRQAVSFWGKDVPKLRAYQLQLLTGGVLRADESPKRGSPEGDAA